MADFRNDGGCDPALDGPGIAAGEQAAAFRGFPSEHVDDDIRIHQNAAAVRNVIESHWSKKSASIVSLNWESESAKGGDSRRRASPDLRPREGDCRCR